jgi:hypothetical protein
METSKDIQKNSDDIYDPTNVINLLDKLMLEQQLLNKTNDHDTSKQRLPISKPSNENLPIDKTPLLKENKKTNIFNDLKDIQNSKKKYQFNDTSEEEKHSKVHETPHKVNKSVHNEQIASDLFIESYDSSNMTEDSMSYQLQQRKNKINKSSSRGHHRLQNDPPSALNKSSDDDQSSENKPNTTCRSSLNDNKKKAKINKSQIECDFIDPVSGKKIHIFKHKNKICDIIDDDTCKEKSPTIIHHTENQNESSRSVNDGAHIGKPSENGDVIEFEDIKKITSTLSKNMVNDVMDTHKYISENKYEIMIDFLNYLVLIIDFLNKLIYKSFIILQEKILGNNNNFVNFIEDHYNDVTNKIVNKVSERTIDKLEKMKNNM